MSYGIEVFNSSGKTVFNSTHHIQLAAYNTTLVGADKNATPTTSNKLAVPDYLFGDDQHQYLGGGSNFDVYTGSLVAGATYTNNRRIALKVVATDVTIPGFGTFVSLNYPFTYGAQYRIRTSSSTAIDELDTTAPISGGLNYGPYNYSGSGGSASNYNNAYWLVNTDTVSMVSYRTTGTSLNIQKFNDSYSQFPQIWARPVSSSYSGRFAMRVLGRECWIVDYTGNNNSFEIMVAIPAHVFGSITSTTAHRLAGNDPYGLCAVTDDQQQYTAEHPLESHLTYDSRTFPVKPIIAVGAEGATAGTNQTITIGSLTSSTVKRWALMDYTLYHKNANVALSSWTLQYNWTNNSSINLLWREGFNDLSGGSVFNTMASKAFFSIAEFGDGV